MGCVVSKLVVMSICLPQYVLDSDDEQEKRAGFGALEILINELKVDVDLLKTVAGLE